MPLFAIAIATLLIAALTAGAAAVRTVSRLWLRHWVEHHPGNSAVLAQFLDRPSRLIHAASTGVVIVVFTLAAIIVMGDGTRSLALLRDLVIASLVILIFGQLLPRALARRWAQSIIPLAVPALRAVDLLTSPFLRIALWVTRRVRRAGRGGVETNDADDREGLEELLRDEAFEGAETSEEMAIITGVMQFGEKRVADVMTPRAEVFALDAALAPGELAHRVAQSGYSRVPLYTSSLDDIVGMVHAFDVFRAETESRPALRPVVVTSPGTPANELLFDLLRTRRQLAIVRDESNALVGLVTLEDLLEELVGDIRDEHDEPVSRGG